MAYDDVKDAPGLYRLGELEDYAVADDDPDVRGWQVLGRNGKSIGRVEELIVDPTMMKVRYLDVDLDDEFVKTRSDYRPEEKAEYHLLVPIGTAVLDVDDDEVLVNTVDPNVLLSCPVYDGDVITRDYENALRHTITPSETDYADENYYEHDIYSENTFYGPRRVQNVNVPTPADQAAIRRRALPE
jgi:photosynthetic reaction center H subunit